MRPPLGVHIFRAGCTIFKDVQPECAHFFSHLSSLHIRRVHGAVPGCTVSEGVHLAQSRSLISDMYTICLLYYRDAYYIYFERGCPLVNPCQKYGCPVSKAGCPVFPEIKDHSSLSLQVSNVCVCGGGGVFFACRGQNLGALTRKIG